MLYLYLDESGDLGFDFVNKKPSVFFTVCVLAIKGHENDRALAKTVRATIRHRLLRHKSSAWPELKGSATDIGVKRSFYKKAKELDFKLYAVTLDKKKTYRYLSEDKSRIYNYLARMALEQVDFKDAAIRVIMTVDKSRARQAVAEFNRYVIGQIKALINPLIPLDIFHQDSAKTPNLQAVDLFAWGIFRKHEKQDGEWYGVFREKIREERLLLP